MTRVSSFILGGLLLVLALGSGGAWAQGAVQARVDPAQSTLSASGDAVALRLSLSQPVPYRVRLLPNPPRVVMEFNTLDWQGLDWPKVAGLRDWRYGHRGDGWARMVLDLGFPMLPDVVAQSVDAQTGRAEVKVTLRRAALEAFEARATNEADFVARYSDHLLHASAPAATPSDTARPLRVMLDPGHGGLDPGAVRDDQSEAALVLAFAQTLRAELARRGGFEVHMTRDADVFVSLDQRLRAAREVQADLFLSLHADALPEGLASGAAVYTLSEDASDQTAEILSTRHARDDLLAGVDLSRNTDEIASVLMSVAWQDTKLRNAALAQALAEGIGAAGLRLHRRPVQSGAFSVLRAPDMPSALLELGFMSSPRDMARLQDPQWRDVMARAVADALEHWHSADRARRAALHR